MKIYIGIDPGASGAIAIIAGEDKWVYDFDDSFGFGVLKDAKKADCKAVIEKVSAMPGQGVSSMFSMGENLGRWVGRLEALEIPFDYVTPQRWKKAMFDTLPAPVPAKKDESRAEKQKRLNERSKLLKELSRERAMRLFPDMAGHLSRKKDHNRAEALLLAAYAQKTMV